MIAVSTFRPHSKDAQYAINQSRAVASWEGIFDDVYLIGKPEPDLTHPYVTFIAGEEFPRITSMLLLLTFSEGWGAWINCDIILNKKIKEVMRQMEIRGYQACTSQRWQYEPTDWPDLSKARVPQGDYGLDIFITHAGVWEDMQSKINPDLRKAGMVYDTWITGYLWNTLGFGYRNFTNYKCVFHPKHEGRQKDFCNSPQLIQDKYGKDARIPPELEMDKPVQQIKMRTPRMNQI
jgi:hypothetical protein